MAGGSGKQVEEGEPIADIAPSTVTRVRVKAVDVDEVCRWIPEGDHRWTRVLYCDWMKAEGWIQQEGLFDVWIKPAAE